MGGPSKYASCSLRFEIGRGALLTHGLDDKSAYLLCTIKETATILARRFYFVKKMVRGYVQYTLVIDSITGTPRSPSYQKQEIVCHSKSY